MEQNLSLEAKSSSRNSQHFMEPEGSLRRLEDPATCPYPNQSNPIHVFLAAHVLHVSPIAFLI